MTTIAVALSAYARIGIDTPSFIYQIEQIQPYFSQTALLFHGLASGDFEGVTSVITLMEAAVLPLRQGRFDIAEDYELFLHRAPHLHIVDIDATIARSAAAMRATHRLLPADALQLAACIAAGANVFVTNDRRLARVTEIPILLLSDFIDG